MSETPQVTVNVESGIGRVLNVVGTILLCGAVGLVAYSLAQRGWLEIAATLLTAFVFQLTRMLLDAGLIDPAAFNRKGGDTSQPSGAFAGTRGLVRQARADWRVAMAESPLWRLGLIAVGYAILFMAFRAGASVALTVFSNMWIAMAAAALLGAIIIAPGQIMDLLRALRVSKAAPSESPDTEKEDA